MFSLYFNEFDITQCLCAIYKMKNSMSMFYYIHSYHRYIIPATRQ